MEDTFIKDKLKKNTMTSPRFVKRLELKTKPVSIQNNKHRNSLPKAFQRHFEAYQDYKAKQAGNDNEEHIEELNEIEH